MLECPEDGELPEAEEADRLSMGEAAQTPDVKPICQCSPIIIPQSVDIPEHADDGCGYSGLFIAKEAAKDEVSNPLTISQLRRRLVHLPPQEVPQILDLQGRKPSAIYGVKVIDTQDVQSLRTRYGLTRGNPTPKANTQDGAPIHEKHPHLTGAKMESPRMVEEPFHPTPHQGMPHVHITDTEEGAKAQLHQKLSILLMSSV